MRTDDVRTAEFEALEAERAEVRPVGAKAPRALIGERPTAFVAPPAEAAGEERRETRESGEAREGREGRESRERLRRLEKLEKTERPRGPETHGRRDPDAIRHAFETGDYPYTTKVKEKAYLERMLPLQVELLKPQAWVKETGEQLVVLFEGRDAAGKGGTIKRFMEHLNPRGARVVALEKPTERERTQWYFQRYVAAPADGAARSCCSTAPGTTAPASSA